MQNPNINLIKPKKPISQMTEEELDQFTDELYMALESDYSDSEPQEAE